MRKLDGVPLGLTVFAKVVAGELAVLFAGVSALDSIKQFVTDHPFLTGVALCILPVVAASIAIQHPNSFRRFFRTVRDLILPENRTAFLRPRDELLTGVLHTYRLRFAEARDAHAINVLARNAWGEKLSIGDDELTRWVEASPASFRVAVRVRENGREAEIVGYTALLGMGENIYNRLTASELAEVDLRLEDLIYPSLSQAEVLYILDLAVATNDLVRAALLRDLIRHIGAIVRQKTSIRRIGCWMLTPVGKAVAGAFEFTFVARHAELKSTAFYEAENPSLVFSSSSPVKYIRDVLEKEFEPKHAILK